jgi:hypothetical protein
MVDSSSKETGSPSVVCGNDTLETSSESHMETGTMQAGLGQPPDRVVLRVSEVPSPEPNIVLAGVHWEWLLFFLVHVVGRGDCWSIVPSSFP